MEIQWNFKSDAEPQGSSDGFWYDLVYGRYIDPGMILSDPNQLKVLEDAIKVVTSFEQAMGVAGLINEF
jgi:hypothetical protein